MFMQISRGYLEKKNKRVFFFFCNVGELVKGYRKEKRGQTYATPANTTKKKINV